MQINCTHIPYSSTGYFSKLVIDYLNGAETLTDFYNQSPNLEGIKSVMEARKNFPHRKELVRILRTQYQDLPAFEQVDKNLELLLSKNTFTVTTAHQPNIFTGPLYVIYKILHAVKLAASLKNSFPENNFVPVYYMGSEDADLDELNHISVDGKVYEWTTSQTGAVGRMLVDDAFFNLINEMQGQLGVLPFGNELVELFRKSYQKGISIQKATMFLMNELFGEFGLVILIPDDAELKKIFEPVILNEIETQFSHNALEPVKNALGKHYKVQTSGREINLFYLIDDKRERIEKEGEIFKIKTLDLSFTKEEIISEVKSFPERFSGNVVLRGLFQETILPNLAFIGGGGELAYWMELKKVFETVGISYPVLLLRNSFLLLNARQQKSLEQLGFTAEELFQSEYELAKQYVLKNTDKNILPKKEIENINQIFVLITEKATDADATLEKHVLAMKAKNEKLLHGLEKKIIRAEKRKNEEAIRKIEQLKSVLFPGGNLQERTENFAGFYARYGRNWLENIAACSEGLSQEFTIVFLEKEN